MFFKHNRRRALFETSFPDGVRTEVMRAAPWLDRLAPGALAQAFSRAQVLLGEKRFEACGGLALTDTMKAVIAAQAAVPILGLEDDYYPRLISILVYPTTFVAEASTQDADGLVTEGPEDREGETWEQGSLVLSWADVERDSRLPDDGYNVVLHEFAHQLDFEHGLSGGSEIIQREYRRHAEKVDAQEDTLLDEYGATHPEEFFAVASECFFLWPADLEWECPELYSELRRFYRQDPALWPGQPGK